ncbi:MAG: isopeptide-forming domain-containing fimbrial protein, partial [Clostridia bacterium]|nr:isopeptide-forming domain-containing fimbrial protein [Clostridia bacterium]
AWGIENDAQVGDKVEFKSVATILKNTRNVKIYDKMDEGLTYSGDVKIEGLTKGTDYTVVENTADGYAFVITFKDSYLEGLTEEKTDLTLTYTAILNENAIVTTGNETTSDEATEIVPQKNYIEITFGDAQSVKAETVTTTHKFSVYKHAEDKTEYLAGATFSLKKNGTVVKLIRIDDNNYRVANGEEEGAVETFTTNDKGDIVIWGVDSDTDYTLKETAAPSGYNMLTDEVAVTVNADNATRADITNSTGVKLPTTGGMGTKMFYIVGMMLMTGSAVMLITKKHMKAE